MNKLTIPRGICITERMIGDNMDEINDGHHFNTTEFMNYLVKNLQVLCQGHVPFIQNLEVIGHIYIKVDCSAKFNCFLNEVVSKTDSCETLFTSNSFQAQSQTESSNRTVINNLKSDVDAHFQGRPIITECSSTDEDICMPVLLKEETAGHFSVLTKEKPCTLKENQPKKSNAENTLNLETAKTCISLPSINTCSSPSIANDKNVCNSPPLTNETTHYLSLPTEANISNPTQYGNIWNSLSIVNLSPSTANENKESWDPSVVTKQNSLGSSIEDVPYTPVTRAKSRCYSVKFEPDESHDNNSTVVEFAKSEDQILQYNKEFKIETIQTNDSANDFTYIPTSNTDNTDEQTLCDSINLLHNIETLHKAEEHALSGSINLLPKLEPEEYTLSDSINLIHNFETPHDTEEQTLSDSVNFKYNTETLHDTEEQTLRDSINLKHNTETPHDTEEQTLSDSFNLKPNIETLHDSEEHALSGSINLKHNIETHHDTEASSNILLENINNLDGISKELTTNNIDDGSETTEEMEADCSSGDNTFIEEDSDSSDFVIEQDFPALRGVKRKFSDDKENASDDQFSDSISAACSEQPVFVPEPVIDFVEDLNNANRSTEVPFPVINLGSKKPATNKKKNIFRKPERYCMYCKNIIKGGKLRRHILRQHKDVDDVKDVLNYDKSVQDQFFDQKRREGIFHFNLQEMAHDRPSNMRERRSKHKDNLRVCFECKSFFSSKFFWKHKCVRNSSNTPLKPRLMEKTQDKLLHDKEFNSLLNRFRDDEIGALCRTDPLIKQVGYKHFNLRRHEVGKTDEVSKVVMIEMRLLARIFLVFKSVCTTDDSCTMESMFRRQHLEELREALQIVSMTDDGKKEKHGLKLFGDAVIMRTIKRLAGYFSETMQDEKYKELEMFKIAYKSKSAETLSEAR